jgi:hypothetical protein
VEPCRDFGADGRQQRFQCGYVRQYGAIQVVDAACVAAPVFIRQAISLWVCPARSGGCLSCGAQAEYQLVAQGAALLLCLWCGLAPLAYREYYCRHRPFL